MTKSAKEVARSERSRVFLLSNVVDIIYGSLPTPFFTFKDAVAPEIMMTAWPGWFTVIVSFATFAFGSYVTMMLGGANYLIALLICVFCHWTACVFHAIPYQSEKLFDLTGQVAFYGMTAFCFFKAYNNPNGLHARQVIATTLSLIWSFRLGYFLFTRFLSKKYDFRFLQARTRYGYMFFTWTAQGFWCFLQALPILALNFKPTHKGIPAFAYTDRVGWFIFVVALSAETIADHQKTIFANENVVGNNSKKVRPFCDKGLWSLSRHPNYCGETMTWVGLFFACCGSYETLNEWICGVTGPIFSMVFLMQTSLPWIEFVMDKRYGNDIDYWRYKLRTSAYWILPPRPRWI